jgi:hypothetical protein
MPSSQPSRGCLLFVIQSADSMARPIRALDGVSGIDAARALAEGVLNQLVALRAEGALGSAGWDVAALACTTDDQPLRHLLSGSDDWPFVPLENLSGEEIRLSEFPAVGPGGTGGLARAVGLLQTWLLTRDRPLRPLLVYCSDESGLGPELVPPAQWLRVLCTPCGPAVLAVCGFSSEFHKRVPPAPVERDPWRLAWQCATGTEKHALSLNDDSPERLVVLARTLGLVRERAPAWTLSGEQPVRCESRVLWAPSSSKSDEEYEDSFAVDEEAGRAVLADGASQGIFVNLWARRLTDRLLHLDDPNLLAGPLEQCRREWRDSIRYHERHPLEQDKIDTVGAAATLLALSLHCRDGRPRWRAAAVGDACLFWVRDGSVQSVFPVCRAVDFGVAPSLIPTRKQFAPKIRFLTAEGSGKMGDLYGLATDAVARYLLQSLETGQSINWRRYWDLDAESWREELRQLRRRRLIEDDDSTLLLLRLKG